MQSWTNLVWALSPSLVVRMFLLPGPWWEHVYYIGFITCRHWHRKSRHHYLAIEALYSWWRHNWPLLPSSAWKCVDIDLEVQQSWTDVSWTCDIWTYHKMFSDLFDSFWLWTLVLFYVFLKSGSGRMWVHNSVRIHILESGTSLVCSLCTD